MAKVAQSLAKLISQSKKKKTGPYDTRATVKRVEGNTVWVSIPGGVDETPINKTVNCSAGDKVQVRVSGGRAWITGNASAPPTDDKTANEAKTKAVVAEAAAIDAKETAQAVESVAVNANTTAATAKHIAEGVNEHFWNDNTGAHITEVTQEEWNEPTDPNYHSGGNTLITTQGMAIRNGLTNLAEFGASGAQIGQTGESHINVDFHSLKQIDKDGLTYVNISDVRDSDGWYTEYFTGTGTKIYFTMQADIQDVKVVKVNGTETSAYTFDIDGVTFNTAPANGASIEITYEVRSTWGSKMKAYTFGKRVGDTGLSSFVAGDNVTSSGLGSVAMGTDVTATGEGSCAVGSETTASYAYAFAEGKQTTASSSACHAEGMNTTASGNWAHSQNSGCEASGDCSHAEGLHTVASGDQSHAQNVWTVADQYGQTAIGYFNTENNTDNLFVVGNGGQNNRSDAFQVDTSGNVKSSGNITDGTGNVLSNKADNAGLFKIVDLSWTEPAINAHDHGTTATHTVPTADIPDGMTLVGIVGWTSGNYRIYPYVFHTNGANSISVTMANATAANSASTTVHAYLLYIKATSA